MHRGEVVHDVRPVQCAGQRITRPNIGTLMSELFGPACNHIDHSDVVAFRSKRCRQPCSYEPGPAYHSN